MEQTETSHGDDIGKAKKNVEEVREEVEEVGIVITASDDIRYEVTLRNTNAPERLEEGRTAV